MNVVLINLRTSYIMSIPLGIASLAAILIKSNHAVRLFDIYPEDNTNEMINELTDSFIPDLIGFSVMTTNFSRAKGIASLLRKKFPNAKLCAGGIHPTVRPRETLEGMDIDFAVIGEGEKPLLNLCNAIENSYNLELKSIAFKNGREYYINRELNVVEDLDTLPFPARELLPVSRYLIPLGYIRSNFLNRVLSVYTSRGWPAKCTFCNSASLFHNRIRQRSVNNVMREINYLINRYNLDGIYFHDETFTFNKKWIKELCEEIKPLGISWGCQTRVNYVDDNLLYAMKDANCLQIDFGIESASTKVLKTIRKGHTPEQTRRALRLLRKHKIKSFASFMVGLPGETEEDLILNIKFIKENKIDFTYFNLFTPFPGTKAAETAIEEGKLKSDYFSKEYDMLIDTAPIANLSAVSTETLIKYHRKLRNMVFLRNYIGILTKNNLYFISKAIFYILLSPIELVRALCGFLKAMNIEKLIFCIFTNYQRWESTKSNK